MNLSLIANSGIQFHKFKLNINLDDDVLPTMAFYEYINESNGDTSIEYAYKIPAEDIYTPKSTLKLEGYLDDDDNLKKDINLNTILELPKMEKDPEVTSGYYKINDIETCLEYYENVWLPFPYFKINEQKKSEFGPYTWSRIMLKNITPKNYKKGQKLYEVILAFDTTISKENDSVYYTPREEDAIEPYNIFAPSNNEDMNLNFCNEEYNCGWVNDYLRELRIEGEMPRVFALKYLAEYLYLIKYLSGIETFYKQEKLEHEIKYRNTNTKNIEKRKHLETEIENINEILESSVFPEVSFYSDKQTAIDVDLVLDIGNSNTCGLLFESPADQNKSFNFNSVKKLEIIDLSNNIADIYDDPFSMRLVFAKAQIGNIHVPEFQNCFKWPSLIRVGKEAQRLINLHNIDKDKGSETATNNSSPKRYLWDNKRVNVPWEFVNFLKPKKDEDEDKIIIEFIKQNEQAIFEGISEQFDKDGEYMFDTNTSLEPYYSRKSLMTFVYIETFLHALRQINSHSFREKNDGSVEKPRKLKRVTITCPTSIVQKEQVILRQCAVDAASAIKRFYEGTYNESVDATEFEIDFKVIPEPKDLAKDLDEVKEKKDWIYDEATCNQLVFLFAEVSERYLNNSETFFNLYGKKRNDVDAQYQKSVTIASIDIGGGTTDLMIAAHEYAAEQNKAVIRPKPLFWDSFTLAGDDLMKKIIKQIVIEGVIKDYAGKMNCERIPEKIQNFFGTDTSKMEYKQRVYRKNFNVQVAIPIALRYIQHANSNNEDIEIGFNELFPDNKPNPDLISYINMHFGSPFIFEEIKWKLSHKLVSKIIDETFDRLFKPLSMLISAYNCDFLLLSGRLTAIPKIREMFIKYYPVSPDRIISLNQYRVGRWYPTFGKEPDKGDLGYFKEPKTIVSVGAIIALMAGRLDKLGDFRLDTEYLIKDLLPTTEYIGAFDKETKDVKIIYLSPEENKNTIEISGLPVTIGYKQLVNDTYPGRPIYKLDFNDEYIRLKVTKKDSSLENEADILSKIDEEKTKVKREMPLKIKLSRQYRNNKEKIEIVNIKDKKREDLSEKLLVMSLMTLPEETDYWLDTGGFILNIK